MPNDEREQRRKRAQIDARRAGNARSQQTSKPKPDVAATKPARPGPAVKTARKAVERQPAKRAPDTTDHAPRDVHKAVESMAIEHVQCRDFGHSWRPYTARWIASFNQYESQLLCARCKTIRTRFLSRTGGLVDSKYDYADGYTIKGLGRLSGEDRDVIRLSSILAVLTPDTADDE